VKFHLPLIAGANGAVDKFELKLGRTWRHEGERRSFLLARCAGGKLAVRTGLRFGDGSRLRTRLVGGCRAGH
jgi:hypothetical protein